MLYVVKTLFLYDIKINVGYRNDKTDSIHLYNEYNNGILLININPFIKNPFLEN